MIEISATPVRDELGYLTGAVHIAGPMEVRAIARPLPPLDVGDETGTVLLSLRDAQRLSGMLPHVLAEIEAALGAQDGPGGE